MPSGWVATSLGDTGNLLPGSHVIVLTHEYHVGIEARRQGLEVRDCILVVSRTGSRFAWLLRKPLEGTVAENVLRYGTGAINIDGCRVGTTVETWPKRRSYGGGTEYAFTRTGNGVVNSQPTGSPPPGRWPANLVFLHGPGCRKAGTKRVPGTSIPRDKPAEADGMETVAAYECEDGCPVAALDQQSGTLKSGTLKSGTKRGLTAKQVFSGGGSFDPGSVAALTDFDGDSGGASRFFPQFENENLLIEWLERLIGVNT